MGIMQRVGKTGRRIISLLILGALASGAAFSAGAAAERAEYVPYSTYIYDYNGYQVETPHAYLPQRMVNGDDLGVGSLSFPSDLETGPDGCLYLSDLSLIHI